MANADRESRAGDPRAAGEFTRAFSRLASRRRRAVARGFASVLVAVLLAALSLLAALQGAVGGARWFPLFSFVLFWTGMAAALYAASRGGVLRPRGDAWLARRLGSAVGQGYLVASALEFSRPQERHGAYSPYLVAKTIETAGQRLEAADPASLFPREGRPAWTLAGMLLAVVLIGEIALLGAQLPQLAGGISDPTLSFKIPSGHNLVVTSGNRMLLSGGEVTLEAIRFGSARGEVALETSTVPGIWKRQPIGPDTTVSEGVALVAYRHTMDDVREGFDYRFAAASGRSAIHRVEVVHRPVINRLGAVLIAPPYTSASPETLHTLAGRVGALVGSRIVLEGETSKPLRGGTLEFSGGGREPLVPTPGGFTGAFTVERSDTFSVSVTDTLGLSNEHRVHYPVQCIEDSPPVIELLAPDNEAQLPRSLDVRLFFRASDDYGVAGIRLFFMKEGKEDRFRSVRLGLPQGESVREVEAFYDWSLEGERLYPGDRVAYFLEAADNNTLTGPGRARTRVQRLVVPSLSQIYAKLRDDESVQDRGLEQVVERSREIREDLQRISNELKAGGELDWSRRREARELMKKQEDLSEKIRDAAERLDRTIDMLDRNRMTSQEIGEKMEELHRLLGEIENEDIRRLMERMQRMLQDVPQDELMRAMNEMELDMNRLAERLDRTLELLRQVLREERMEELVRGMEEMLERQRALRDSTATGDLDELADEQERLAEDYRGFEENLEEFADGDSSAARQLEEMMRDMQRSAVADSMRRAAGEMERGEREPARCTQGAVIDDMLSLYTCLGRCSMSMSMSIDRELLELIQRSTRELIEISKLQEAIVPGIEGGIDAEGRAGAIEEQLVLKEAVRTITERLYGLARKTMILSEAVFVHLGLALHDIERVLASIEQMHAPEAGRYASGAYNQLNLAAIELLRSSASSGSSGGSARERMQMMMQQQLSIDQQLRRLLDTPRESLSMETRARMARLAAEQRRMQEIIEQIQREKRGAGELLGRLDDIENSMEELAERLERGELDEELLDVEERILSRMLESQRSINRRDFKRERVSRTGEDLPALVPDGAGAVGDERELLLRRIARGMQEKGPAEYEELIKLYFRALSRKLREGN